jgi:hypothetical protein
MGLFSKPEPLHPTLARIAMGYMEKYEQGSLRYVAKHQSAILAALEPGETPQIVAVHSAGLRSHLVLFTDRRIVDFYGKEVGKVIALDDVAGVEPLEDGSMMFVAIASKTALLDFAPSDPKRDAHIITAPVKTPRQQQQVAELATSRR